MYERRIYLICRAFSYPFFALDHLMMFSCFFLQDEGNKIAHFSSSNNTLFLCVLWKVLLDTDYISNVSYKVLDRIGTKQLVNIALYKSCSGQSYEIALIQVNGQDLGRVKFKFKIKL